MWAYYNEHDPYAAEWLRRLILFGHIAPGEVDERSIEDVAPDDVRGFTQCHFFAGIGVWSYALRLAGWSDERRIWTASCPCQPLSAAGKGLGFADERHLWPAFHHLLRIVRPPVVAGEQVASKAADAWVDLVQADVEALGYAFGCVPFPAASVGAPHIRDRNYWLAYNQGDAGRSRLCNTEPTQHGLAFLGDRGDIGGLADDDDAGLERWRQPGCERSAECVAGTGGLVERLAHSYLPIAEQPARKGTGPLQAPGPGPHDQLNRRSDARRLADDAIGERGEERPDSGGSRSRDGAEGLTAGCSSSSSVGGLANNNGRNASSEGLQRSGQHGQQPQNCGATIRLIRPGPTNGFWRDADWLRCRDERWRPVEPGTFPLVNGATARVGRLRAYGNAIVAEAAKEFMSAAMECLPC